MSSSEHSDSSPLLTNLRAAGWRVQSFHQGWWRCLIEDDDGYWIGESSDESGAVEAAFRSMIPSARARAALVAAWGKAVVATTDTGEAVEVPADAVAEPSAAAEPSEASPEAAPEPPVVEAPPVPALPLVPREEALERLEEQREGLLRAFMELGELAPSRIRLLFLLWVAEMRAVEEACPGEPEVSEAGRGIANLIQEQAFVLWPGMVPALQLSARPRDCRGALGEAGEGLPLAHWQDVADAARAAIERLESQSGRDEDGWADARALAPRPNDPDGLLVELRGRFERLASSWQDRERRIPALDDLRSAELRATLLDLARRARWLRGGVADVESWSEMVGHLRRIAGSCERAFPELGRLLDEGTRPSAISWAEELGQDPTAKRRKRARRDLLQSRPEEGADAERLIAWLLEAFEVFTNPELATLLRPVAAAVGALDGQTMPDRRRRQRLAKLQPLFGERPDAVREEALRKETESGAADAESVGSETPRRADPRDALRERVLPATRGRRLLFVSNRADPHLEQALQAALEPAALEWLVAGDRRVAAATEAIARRSHDLVLCATGFMSHSTEKALRIACANGGIPCIRVYKGRVVSCLRAIERDLGLVGRPVPVRQNLSQANRDA